MDKIEYEQVIIEILDPKYIEHSEIVIKFMYIAGAGFIKTIDNKTRKIRYISTVFAKKIYMEEFKKMFNDFFKPDIYILENYEETAVEPEKYLYRNSDKIRMNIGHQIIERNWEFEKFEEYEGILENRRIQFDDGRYFTHIFRNDDNEEEEEEFTKPDELVFDLNEF